MSLRGASSANMAERRIRYSPWAPSKRAAPTARTSTSRTAGGAEQHLVQGLHRSKCVIGESKASADALNDPRRNVAGRLAFTLFLPHNDPAGSRTRDLRIKSPLLYQLSYRVARNANALSSKNNIMRWRSVQGDQTLRHAARRR